MNRYHLHFQNIPHYTLQQVSHIWLYAELFKMASSCLSCRISCSTTPGVTCTSSACRLNAHVVCTSFAPACHLYVIRTCHPHLHVICTCTCHPHIICSTPHGHHGPKLSFYSDRNWLLNIICHKNVEFFHFRII